MSKEAFKQIVADAPERIATPLGGIEPAPEASELAAVEVSHDWKIPGLLEAREVAMVTGMEGFGKSTFLSQVAVCAASGLDPFKRTQIRPLRVCRSTRQRN